MNKMQERYKRLHQMELDDLVEYTYNLEQQMSSIKINKILIKKEISIFTKKINELLEILESEEIK